MKGFGFARVGAAMVATGAILACAPAAFAQHPDLGAGAPSGQIGVQLYDWSQYLSSGAGEIVCPTDGPATPNCVQPPAPGNSSGRLIRVFQYLASKNVRNVELYGFPGNPFPTNPSTPLNTQGLQDLRALGDSYGLRFVSRHGSLNEANWDNDIAASKILGQEVIGAADPPNANNPSLQVALQDAQLLNRLGKRSVEAGLGPVYFHNHASSFNTKVNINGELKPRWEVLMDNTDPRYVKAQIDLGWAVSGSNQAYIENLMASPVYSPRVISFHVKDVVNPAPNSGTSSLRELGNGDINFTQIFANAKNKVRWYLYEYDPVTPGNNGGFNPFNSADTSFTALTGAPAPVAYAPPTRFTSVPAGTAEANDGGTTTAQDFAVVSQNCTNQTLAPGATCTINVGFKPTRTNYTSVARLQFTANGDDALERVPLYGTSTGDAVTTLSGNVPSYLGLSLPTQPGSFGTFLPTVAKTYDTALAATVTSTAGDATLSVTDPSTTAPGHLVNGGFSLPAALTARAANAANTNPSYVALSETAGTATPLLSYGGPVNGDAVTIAFRQAIAATDVLRSGAYSKTLTFTLSTTTP